MSLVVVWAGVVLLGGVGAVARFLVDRAVSGRTGRAFPYGTLVVNLSGAAVLGFLTGLALDQTAMLLAGTAMIGSYTTFSTWMFESDRLGEDRLTLRLAANVVGSLTLGLIAAGLGHLIGGWV